MRKPEEEEEGIMGRGQALSWTETGSPSGGRGSRTHYLSCNRMFLSDDHEVGRYEHDRASQGGFLGGAFEGPRRKFGSFFV